MMGTLLGRVNKALNIHVLNAADIGGSMLIHTFGAYFGIIASPVLFHDKARDHSRNSTVYHLDLLSIDNISLGKRI